MSAPLPHDEEERLQELFSYAVLDTAPEPAFDRITRLAARMLHAPVALISFVDRDRQWVKSRLGTELHETARCDSICAHTILGSEVLIVPDLLLDPRFEDLAAQSGVSQPRFYAGAPLVSPFGHRLGTLCVVDVRPRKLEPEQVALLTDLAALAVDEVVLRQVRERSRAALEAQRRVDEDLLSLREELELRVDRRTTLLINAEARYRSIFENALEGIYQTQPDGRFLNVNPAFARLLGYASPAALTESIPDAALLYVDAGRRAEFRRALEAEGSVNHWESQFYRANGARIWVSENARAIRDADGLLLRFEGTVEDISARKLAEDAIQHAHEELEARVRSRTAELALLNGTLRQQIAERDAAEANSRRSESKFRALIENAQDLITILTPDGTVLYQSPSVQHVLGCPADEASGINLFEHGHIHPDDHGPFREMLARFAQGDASYVRSEVRLRHRDGSWRLLESIGSALPSDSPLVGIVINSRDITDRRRTELEHLARTRQQTAIAELGRCALDGPELPAIFDKAAELVARALEITLTTVTEITPDGTHLLIRAGTGWAEGTVGHALVENWRPLRSDGRHHEEPLVIEDLRLQPECRVQPLVPADEAPVSAASVVVWGDGELFGTLCAMSTEPRHFSAQDVTFLQTMADLLSTIIRSKHHEAASRGIDARYRRIVANTPGMVFQYVVHADGTLTLPFISEHCRSIYELEPAQLQAEPRLLGRLVHPEDKENYKQIIARAFETLQPFHWEGRVALPSGTVRWLTARSRPERQANGDVIWDGVVLDVSELKLAEDAMLTAKEEAERANAAKSEFLSRMSHELRTPLNAILGFGQLLALERLTAMQNSSVEQILKGGHHLLNLINEVLDIARIEAGGMEMNLEGLDVRTVLDEALRFAAPLAEQHRVHFIPRGPREGSLAVLADRGRLHQVLLNLLSNAVKYNRPEGEVRVGARRTGTGQVRISIADTGLGIDGNKLDRLFTPFQRLDAPQWGVEGTGIGLTISKSLVEAMGGTIGVESSPRRGSTFFVDLPLAPEPPALAAPDDAPAAGEPPPVLPPGTRTVLHIDDHPANLDLVQHVLKKRADLRLLTATSGQAGLELACAHRPDVVLLDLHLPDLDGGEIVRRLRDDPRTRDVPVLIVSADATSAQTARLRQLGVRGYLTKPFRIRELLDAIDTAFNPPPQAAPAVS